MVHELIAPYYTGGDTRDLKEHIDEVKPLLLIIFQFTINSIKSIKLTY